MGFDTDRGDAPKADDRSNSSQDFLQRAARAVEAGDAILGVHLYLAAFERALDENMVPSYESLMGMEEAWRIAIKEKQRSLAEYIFERLEPYLNEDAVNSHADELQRLAFDKLEDLGFPRDALESMAELMDPSAASSEDDADAPSSFMGFDLEGEDGLTDLVSKRAASRGGIVQSDAADQEEQATEPSDALSATQEHLKRKLEEALAQGDAFSDGADDPQSQAPSSSGKEKTPKVSFSQIVIPPKGKPQQKRSWFDYSDLCGYDRIIARMGKMGIGHRNDASYRDFVRMLNDRHGLVRPPALDTLMFVSEAREDASYFMVATAGELRVPMVRLRFDRNAAGQTVMVVMASPDFPGRMSQISRSGFTAPAAVLLEDVDLWQVPELNVSMDEMNMSNLMQIQVSRGAREALAFLSVALATPEVAVMASCASPAAVDPYFRDLLGMCTTIPVDFPNAEERRQLWRKAQAEHPSLRGLDVCQLVPFSKGMSRYEIGVVVNDAVENAYRESLERRRFCAVSTEDVLMRLSAFHPLDSSEYHQMEDALVSELSRSLDGGIDSLLGGR